MGADFPLISVVIPTCHRPSTLIACIESIKVNDYHNYEIIVVDQSTDDETRNQIGSKFSGDRRIVYLHSSIQCSSDSRNKGWKAAKGEIIVFTDDDAFVDKGWLEAYANSFINNDDKFGMIGGRIIPIFEIERPSWLPFEKDYLLPSFDAGNESRLFPEGSLPISVNFALPIKVLREVNGFDTRLGLKRNADMSNITGEDSFLALKVKDLGYNILYQPAAIVYHPIIARRLTRRFFIKRNFWQGITTIAVENAMEQCSKQKLSNHIYWHFKRVLRYLFRFLREFVIPAKGRSMKYMLIASELFFSIGVIRYSIYLRKGLHS